MSSREEGHAKSPDDILTASEAAIEKNVTPQAVTEAIRKGRLRARRTNGIWLIRRGDLDDWTPRSRRSKGTG